MRNIKLSNSFITVGAFDGVHRGHQEILQMLKSKAQEKFGKPVVVTFWPHPSHVIGAKPLMLLNTLEEKKNLIRSFGINEVIVLPFTYEFSRINSHDFIKNYLIEQFGMKYFLVGYNHHFGSDRQNDIHILKHYGNEYGFDVEKASPIEVDGDRISSTKIRHAITEGKLDLANLYLGYNYYLGGKVVKGQMLGRTIGFPTANVQVEDEFKIIPKDGVYAAKVKIGEKTYPGMLNIGHRPTVNKDILHKTIEVHILDFNKDIYEHHIKVEFVHRLRDEVKFKDIVELKNQLFRDMQQVRKILA
jgi:riboflavin kinase/FMN adenylyltransferase